MDNPKTHATLYTTHTKKTNNTTNCDERRCLWRISCSSVLLRRHTTCYSYIQSSPTTVFYVIVERNKIHTTPKTFLVIRQMDISIKSTNTRRWSYRYCSNVLHTTLIWLLHFVIVSQCRFGVQDFNS